MDEPIYVVHDDPVHRSISNYIGMVDLDPYGLSGQLEQVWLRSLDQDQFELCCIPFAAYGLSLGDVVEVTADGIVSKIVRKSGNRTLRFLFKSHQEGDFQRVTELLSNDNILFEGRGRRQVSVNLTKESQAAEVIEFIGELVVSGRAFWEWNDVLPFSSNV